MADEDVKGAETATAVDIFDTGTAAENPAVMEVRAPATNEVVRFSDNRPWTIELYGKDCAAFQELARKQQDRRISSTMRTRAPILSAVGLKDDIELLVVLTKTWDVGFPGLEKPTQANFRAAYTKYRQLREQVDEFTGVVGNFMKG